MDLETSLIEQLAATNAGEPWYGTSRSALLAGLSAEQAAEHSVPGVHSIWEEVLHMTSWTNEVRRRLDGQMPATPVEGDWPAVAQESIHGGGCTTCGTGRPPKRSDAATTSAPWPAVWDTPIRR